MTKQSKRKTPAPRAPVDSAGERDLNVAVDVVVLTVEGDVLKVLLHRRRQSPHEGAWALPGVFVRIDESLEAAARRAVSDKGLQSKLYLEQLYTFGNVARDPRGRVISVSYIALVDAARLAGIGESTGGGANEAEVELATVEVPWAGETGGTVDLRSSTGDVIEAPFDHAQIVGMAIKRLRGKLEYAPVGFQLLPERFSLRALQGVYETIMNAPTNKDSFRRRMLSSGLLESTGERESDVEHRPAELFRLVRRSAL